MSDMAGGGVKGTEGCGRAAAREQWHMRAQVSSRRQDYASSSAIRVLCVAVMRTREVDRLCQKGPEKAETKQQNLSNKIDHHIMFKRAKINYIVASCRIWHV